MRPRTKHINCKYHHFRKFVENKEVEIISVSTENQLADLWTKPLSQELFHKFTKETMGFDIPASNEANRRIRDEGVWISKHRTKTSKQD